MFKKIISIIILIVIILVVLFIISPIVIPKWITEEDNYITQIVRGFYAERENSLDVMFMGDSDMYRGVSPMVLWDEYGIASYSYTSPGQRTWTAYYVLLDALRKQKPDIIVFNIDEIQSTSQSTDACYRKAFDNMQLSNIKLKALCDKQFKISLESRLSYLLPIFKYHTRLLDLTPEDFKYAYGYEEYENKGLDLTTEIKGYENANLYMEDKSEKYEFPDVTKKYMDKVVKICKEKGIKLILVEIPSADSWSNAKSQAITEYAKKTI